MQKILLLNLMRMGDILQMTTVIEALRENHPQAQIVLVLNETFLKVGQRIDVDEIIPFAVHPLGQLLHQEDSHFYAYGCLKEFLHAVNALGPYDLVFNLTPSPAAASLSSLISHTMRRGMWIEKDGSFMAIDPWSTYLVSMMSNRKTNSFHLVDIWMRSVDQHGPRSLHMHLYPEDIRKAEEILIEEGINLDKDLLIGFQVSASQKEKCWSEKEFIRLGQALKQGLNARVIFFGVAAERSLCDDICTHIPGSINLAGKTGLGDLAAVLQRCKLLITNDTGTQHVAAAVGTQVIVISVGPVFFRETGPYGEGHFVFQAKPPCAPCAFNISCLNPVCKEMVRSEHIYNGVVHLLRGKEGTPQGLPAEVACYRSGFDETGKLEFSLYGPYQEDRKLLIYKGLWETILEAKPFSLASELDQCLGPETLAGWIQLEDLLRRSSKLIQQIREMGKAKASDPSRWKIISENLFSAEQEMKRMALEVVDLAPFITYLIIRREALSFQDPFLFLQETAVLYSFVAEQMCKGAKNHSIIKEAM